MPANSFGTIFRLTTFGESHGIAIGGVIDGCPAGIEVDVSFIQQQLDRRKPGQSKITTPRKESDIIEILSGVFEGKSLGTPIGFIIRNEDHQSADYSTLQNIYRPGHADEVYDKKFGLRDHRGGGRSSARETAVRVAAGAFAKLLLMKHGVTISAYVSSVKDVHVTASYHDLDLSKTEEQIVRCPDAVVAQRMVEVIEEARAKGDSVGGVITCVCSGVNAGLGAPVFDKLNAVLAHAMLSINASQGFEMEGGFASTLMNGSENNLRPGGVSGGISTGLDIVFRVAFKPVSTISIPQSTHNDKGENIILETKGRHDPCVLPRAVPIVEAMAALVLADMILLQRSDRI